MSIIPVHSGLQDRPRLTFSAVLGGLLALSLLTAACGSDGESDEAFVDTYDSYFKSFSSAYNPSPMSRT